MKKSQIALLIVGVLTVTGVPSLIAIEQANQARIEMERARQATLQAQEAAEAERQKLQQEQEAIHQREAERERQAEARRAEEQVRREEEARIAAEQRRQEAARLAAQQQARQQMAARTADSWNQFAEIMVEVDTYTANTPDADPVAVLKYIVNSVEPIPTNQIDPRVATLIADVHNTTQQAYALAVDYQERQKQLGFDALEASKTGCEIVNAVKEEDSWGWCLLAGALGGIASYTNGNAELEQLEAEYTARLQEMTETFNGYRNQFETVPVYLQETYGIDAMLIPG